MRKVNWFFFFLISCFSLQVCDFGFSCTKHRTFLSSKSTTGTVILVNCGNFLWCPSCSTFFHSFSSNSAAIVSVNQQSLQSLCNMYPGTTLEASFRSFWVGGEHGWFAKNVEDGSEPAHPFIKEGFRTLSLVSGNELQRQNVWWRSFTCACGNEFSIMKN
jgi:hypothetical protein